MQMNKRGAIVTAVMLSLMLAPLAEAKRMGGGKSRGMNRAIPSQTYQQPNNQYRNQPQAQPQAQQKSGSNVGRMVGAGVAGAAIGAMAGHAMANNNEATAASQADAAEKKGGINWVWLILLALGGFYFYRRFAAKKAQQQTPSAGFNGTTTKKTDFTQTASANPVSAPALNTQSSNTNVFGEQLGQTQAPLSGSANLIDGSSTEAFLRFARQRFNHVQAMNSASNIEEIRRYFTPAMFADIQQDIRTNDDVAEFSQLTATVVGQAQESGEDIVSVRFSGQVSEQLGSAPMPFSEVWHFSKPSGSHSDWLIAGIQQD